MIRYILLDPQGGESGGTSTPPDIAEVVKKLVSEKHGNDAMALARELLAKNRELEADNRKYRQKVAGLKSSVPEEGSVVLKGDDAKDWQRYREFGKPGEVKTKLESGSAAERKLDGIGKAETYRKAAKTLGFNEAVFALKAEHEGLVVEVVEEKGKDGKAVQVARVRGEGDSTTPLNEYVDKHWSDIKPALGGEPKDRKALDATPPRPPFGGPPPNLSGESRDVHQQALIRSDIYAAGL